MKTWTRFFRASVCGVLLCALAPSAWAQPAPPAVGGDKPVEAPRAAASLVIVGATVHTGTGEVIQDGVIVVEKGLIQAVGKAIAAPAGAETLDAKGAVVTPGLVDALTSVGLVEVALEPDARDDNQGGKDPIRAAFRAADGYNPVSTVPFVTRAEGITSVGVVPTGGLISGQSAWADLDGATAEEAIVQGALAMHVHLDGGMNGDRGGPASALLRLREVLDDARAFQKNQTAWEHNQAPPFAASRLDLAALGGALSGKLPVVFHVDRAADILSALGVAKEFGLKPLIAGGAEAWKVAARLSAQKVPVLVNPIEPGPASFDSLGTRDDNAALLHAAGVPVVISTGDTHNARKLRQLAGNAVRAGLPHEAAIAAITSAPAEALGMGARHGTIAAGKVANLVVWSGDPLEFGTSVKAMLVRGKRVSLSNRQTALFARYRRVPAGR